MSGDLAAKEVASRRRKGARGFTLIELMVALVIMSILGTLAVASVRRDQNENAGQRFIEDVEGAVTQARNLAIDNQTNVDLHVSRDSAQIEVFDDATKTWTPMFEYTSRRSYRVGEDQAEVQDRVCVLGVVGEVNTPRQMSSMSLPTDCMASSASVTLSFDATGAMSLGSDPDASGATIWIRDKGVGGGRTSVIQVFAGGLVRAFLDV